MPSALLKGACRNAFLVASALDILIDRLAVGCTYPGSGGSLQLLLPLQKCNIDVIRELFRSLSTFRLPDDEFEHVDLSKTLTEASNFLTQCSSRGALCHIFFLTASPGVSLPGHVNHRVRFHTISPEPNFGIATPNVLEGWHLVASFEADNGFDAERVLKERIRLIIRHLHLGVDSGVLSELSISLKPGIGCKIEAVLGETKCSMLRPGEVWTILVKLKTAMESGKYIARDGSDFGHSADEYNENVEIMIDELHGMLKPPASRTEFQTIVCAALEYSHSSLPWPAVVRVEEKCQVAKFPQSGLCYEAADLQSSQSNARGAFGHPFGHQYGTLYEHGEPIGIKKLSRNLLRSEVLSRDERIDKEHEVGARGQEFPPLDSTSTSKRPPHGSVNPFLDLVPGSHQNVIPYTFMA